MVTEAQLTITLVFSPQARVVREQEWHLAVGSTVAQAIAHSGLGEEIAAWPNGQCRVGIWGRRVDLHQVLRDRDRIEIYRPLTVDPKVARRERFVRQGAKTAGLFSKRRPGAKAGY